MTRWLHPPELERPRERDRFDPVVEGARHGLARELSLAIWERVCADATDGFGRRDTEQAQQRFHEIAARLAARGGRLRPDVGRLTRVGTESDGAPLGASSIAELAPRIPGRETLVAAEARRWKAMSAEPAAVLEYTEAADSSERVGGVTDRPELPGASEVAQALASLQRSSPSDPARPSGVSERAAARRWLDVELAVSSSREREGGRGREPREGQLPAATLERMEQAYGQRFDDVEIHADSAEVPVGQQAFTRGRHIYLERGAFEPESDHGEHVIAHELAHVAQQSQPAGDGRRPASRAALEADSHQAALSALAGRAAMVNLFAPPSAALGFSNGKAQKPPASGPGSAGQPPAQSARGSTPSSSAGATHAPGVTRAPTSAGSGGVSVRSGAPPAARPAASNAAASAPPAIAPHRGANADGLLIPEAPGALSPAAAGRLQTIRTDNQGVAAATTTLPSGEQQTDVARAAVVEPQAEQDAHAQHDVVAAVDDRPPPSPEIEAACARIRQVIRDKRPPDEDKLVDAKPKEMAQAASEEMSAGVEPRASTVRQGYADMQNSPTLGRGVAEALAMADPAIAVAAQLRAGGAAESLAVQMRRTFGAAAGDVPIATDSTRPLAAGAEGVAVGEQVYIAPGFYDLTTTAGRERLGHEVAHVLQQRRGRDLPGRITPGERAGLEAEADRAGRAFARGQRFAVQGRAPAQVALFKGATPTKGAGATATTTTTIDLKSGGRIERKPPPAAPAAPAGADPAAAPAAGGKDPPKAKEQLLVTYGAVQASNPFTIERDESGEAKKLVGKAKLTLPASKYMKTLELDISLGPDGYLGAKLTKSATTTIQIGGLIVQGGQLTAAIDRGQLSYALDGANLSLPKNIGDGALTIQGNGDQEPAFDASLSINVPKMQPATMSFHADASGYRAEGSTGVEIKQASGTVTFGLEKVGEDKALWSAAGSVGYNSERLSGQISVQYNADGELSGEGNLQFQIADFLTGQANVAVDKDGHVTVNGEISPPNETQLFPEKKVENTFFHKSLEFPIWGISIPMVGSVGIIAFIEGSMGYRVGVGAGVMRNIVLSGKYSTDPSVEPTFGITGEIFIPAFAELLISIGGGIKLDAFIAEVGGGVKVDGRAGFYGGLSVRPSLAYEGGKYRLTGQAILAGDVGLSAQVDAFVRLHVGKWMFSWEKEWDWKLAEWNKWLGLNLGMEADLDYTLGQPLSPEIFKLKKPDSIDVQEIAKSAMPQGGMPPQGPKGAQHEHEEFKQKGGGGAAASSAPTAKPKVAGTPAGAAGHKNQDPKGKTVKPGKPAKPGPAKKAKGKGPNQTGPNPKNTSKPSEQKLDAKPVIEQFSMHGEPHQLIVQLGPGGHVDMASKRERLSVKVGAAVGKLIAKHASPQQIVELKEIGATAKRGDKMVATAKLTDKPGTAQVAQQIKKYGDKWQVKDLDEVAIKAPSVIVVTHPVRLEKLSEALNKALGSAHSGQVIANKPGDPKEVTRQLLEKHKDAKFDYASARLTLPALNPAPLHAAHGTDQLGQLLAQQTGVTKVSLKQTEQKGQLKFELIGSIGGATATLGTAVVDAVPHSLAVPHPVHLDKPSEQLSKALTSAHSGQVIFHKSSDPKQATRQLLQRHSDARFDFPTAKLTLPAAQAGPLQAAHGVDELGKLLAQQTGVSKISIKKMDQKGETKLEITGEIGPSATLGTAVVAIEEVPKTLSVSRVAMLDKLPDALAESITKATTGDTIWQGPVSDPKEVTATLLHAHPDAHFDPATKNLQLPSVHAAALSLATSLAQLGQLVGHQTGVSKVTLTKTADDHFSLIGAINPGKDVAKGKIEAPAPKSLDEPSPLKIEQPSPSLLVELREASATQVIYKGGARDPKQVTKALLAKHKDAHFDTASGQLTLPLLKPSELQNASSLAQLGQQLADATGVSKVTLKRTGARGKLTFKLIGAIGKATATLGTAEIPKVPPKVNVGDTIEAKYNNVWAICEVTAVDAERFNYEGQLHSGPVRGTCPIDLYEIAWREYQPGRVFKQGEAWRAIKDLSVWKTYADASQTLSYRADGAFRVPPGKNWHHIQEQAGNGEHSVRNLALVDARINQVDFNQWFNRVHPGTGGQKLRQFLRGQPVEVHVEWGKKCIAAHGLTLVMRDKGRGPYQEIV